MKEVVQVEGRNIHFALRSIHSYPGIGRYYAVPTSFPSFDVPTQF